MKYLFLVFLLFSFNSFATNESSNLKCLQGFLSDFNFTLQNPKWYQEELLALNTKLDHYYIKNKFRTEDLDEIARVFSPFLSADNTQFDSLPLRQKKLIKAMVLSAFIAERALAMKITITDKEQASKNEFTENDFEELTSQLYTIQSEEVEKLFAAMLPKQKQAIYRIMNAIVNDQISIKSELDFKI